MSPLPDWSLALVAGVSFGARYDPARCRLVVLTHKAYYDASGNQSAETGVLAFLGVAATVDQWVKLEAAWEGVLRDPYFAVPYFHHKEYAHSVGPFTAWKGKEDRRRAFLAALINVAGKHLERVGVVGVEMESFHRINATHRLAESFGADHPSSGAYAVAVS